MMQNGGFTKNEYKNHYERFPNKLLPVIKRVLPIDDDIKLSVRYTGRKIQVFFDILIIVECIKVPG